MHKSSIYLPDPLKADLAALAARSGRAEADLIRQAIERLLAVSAVEPEAPSGSHAVVRRQGPLLIGVGLGPGDPRHVTDLARSTLLGAQRVFAMSWTSRSIGRAETVARAVAPTVAIERLVHDIAADGEGRATSLRRLAGPVVAALDAGEVVVVVTVGDPTLWSVFGDLADVVAEQRPAIAIEMVPGIAPFQALAAATATTLARPGQRVVLLDGAVPDDLLADQLNAVVVYKGSADVGHIRHQAAATGRLPFARVGELLGVPGERIEALEDLGDGPVSYLATVILPAVEPA
ncbi:MAG: precorrin-2 C20-methyltransferase [Acidimicrobiales bacterium]|nr:precorrin-2 C20-methyltransferase [Acidimicrobiales bacterium]